MKSILFFLVAYSAVTAALSGLLMISVPDGSIIGLPVKLLEETPFRDYLLPGILLTILVAVPNFIAMYVLMNRSLHRYRWSTIGGVMLCSWVIVQMIWIQAAHWLNFLYLGIGVLIILIAYQLKGKWAV